MEDSMSEQHAQQLCGHRYKAGQVEHVCTLPAGHSLLRNLYGHLGPAAEGAPQGEGVTARNGMMMSEAIRDAKGRLIRRLSGNVWFRTDDSVLRFANTGKVALIGLAAIEADDWVFGPSGPEERIGECNGWLEAELANADEVFHGLMEHTDADVRRCAEEAHRATHVVAGLMSKESLIVEATRRELALASQPSQTQKVGKVGQEFTRQWESERIHYYAEDRAMGGEWFKRGFDWAMRHVHKLQVERDNAQASFAEEREDSAKTILECLETIAGLQQTIRDYQNMGIELGTECCQLRAALARTAAPQPPADVLEMGEEIRNRNQVAADQLKHDYPLVYASVADDNWANDDLCRAWGALVAERAKLLARDPAPVVGEPKRDPLASAGGACMDIATNWDNLTAEQVRDLSEKVAAAKARQSGLGRPCCGGCCSGRERI